MRLAGAEVGAASGDYWNAKQVERDIGVMIQAEQSTLLKSLQDFQNKGLITSEEAKTVLPKLSVTIRYDVSLNRTQ